MIPGHTTCNVATESMTNSEAIRRTMENLMRITSECQELDMRKKLKDCQDIHVCEYQHHGDYVEGDKVWFQPLNGNAWIGPALVVTQQGQSVYLHTHGDLKKIAACRVKPFEFIEREEQTASTENNKEVMLEDGLEDVENLFTIELDNDNVDTKIQSPQTVSLSDTCIYTVELPISEHWRPEVKVAKKAEVKNL